MQLPRSEVPASEDTTRRARLRRHGAVVAVCVGGGLTALDLTIVAVALPALGRDLGAGLGGLQWVVNGYTLAFAAAILTAGALADRRGDRPVFATGVAVFTLASAVCALAPTVEVLVAARVVQGLGAAAVLATSISLLARTYSGSARARAIAAWVVVGTLAANLGPLVGGLLVDALGWRGIFLVNVPVGVALLGALPLLLPRTAVTDGPRRPLDTLGAALAVVGLFALNGAVLAGTDGSWTSPTVLGAAAVAVLALGAFVVRAHRLGEDAVVDLALFRIPTFSGAVGISLLTRMGSFGALPFFVLWLQGPVGLDATATGLVLLSLSLPVLVLAFAATRLQRRFSARTLIVAGNIAAATGGILLTLGIGPDSSWPSAVAGFALLGVGSGLVFPSLMGLAVGVVPPQRAGTASGVANTFFPLGTAVGVALFGVLTSAAATDPGDATSVRVVAVGVAALSVLGVLVAASTVRDADRWSGAGA